MHYDEGTNCVFLDDGSAIVCGLLDETACMAMAKEAETMPDDIGAATGEPLQVDIVKTVVPLWMYALGALLAFWWAIGGKKTK